MLPFAGVFECLRRDAMRITRFGIFALALAALAAVPYVPFLDNPLVFDDFNVVDRLDFLNYTFQFWAAPRWLPYATLAHTSALTNGSMAKWRANFMDLTNWR